MPAIKAVLVGLFGVALLAGCGGSEEDTAGKDPGVESVSVGTIEDIEPLSVLIHESQLDAQTAEALDDGDEPMAVEASRLGVQMRDVEVQAALARPDDAVERAARIAFGTAVVGPVEAVNATAKQIKLLGQTIQVSNGTVFDAEIKGGLAGVTVGSILDVRGLLDVATGVTSATRIELRKSADFLLLRGVVSQVNTVNKTLRVGGQLVNLAKLSARTLQGLAQANGKVVRAVLEAKQVNGQFVANAVRSDCRFVADGKAVEIENVVTQYTSNAAFKLSGLPVDAGKAVVVNPANLKLGAKVVVRGALVAGVLVATNVNVKLAEPKNVTRQGTVAALNATAKTFTLNGVKIDFSGGGVAFACGNATQLVNGAHVVVFGKLSADGTHVVAQRIQFMR
ncbi:MAG TPA: DUF5666 domain-containing protein [Burkholderiaceae bacterium]|nr:DUF5666 domain-containing protein [Burkholderiaceae bacterium]